MNTSKFAYKARRIVLRTWLFRKRSSWSVVTYLSQIWTVLVHVQILFVMFQRGIYVWLQRWNFSSSLIVSLRLSFCPLYVRMSVCVSACFPRMLLKGKSDKNQLNLSL